MPFYGVCYLSNHCRHISVLSLLDYQHCEHTLYEWFFSEICILYKEIDFLMVRHIICGYTEHKENSYTDSNFHFITLIHLTLVIRVDMGDIPQVLCMTLILFACVS